MEAQLAVQERTRSCEQDEGLTAQDDNVEVSVTDRTPLVAHRGLETSRLQERQVQQDPVLLSVADRRLAAAVSHSHHTKLEGETSRLYPYLEEVG